MHFLAFAESIQLFPDGTIFVHIAIILLMIWVLNRTFYKPINRVMISREKNKGGRAGEAAEILEKVAEKESSYSKEMLDARSKGYEVVEKEHKASMASREELLSQAKADAHQTITKGKNDIELEAAKVRSSIEAESDIIADRIAESIVKVK